MSYTCDQCGYCYTPQRVNEEISQCPSCFGRQVRCFQSLKYSRDGRIPTYSRANYMPTIMRQMENNFAIYFDAVPERHLDWEWHDGKYHVAFAGGETFGDPIPHVAISKAAIMAPYLWDGDFDWTQNSKVDTAEGRPLSQLLLQLVRGRGE